MNRYPINSRVIGAGGESPLSYVVAFQNFVLHVAATAVAIRGMRASQSLTLEQTARAIITRFFAASQVLALNLSLTTKTYFMKYGTAAQTMALTVAAIARQQIKRYAQSTQALALSASITIHHWIKTYATALQNFALSTSGKYARHIYPSVAQTLAGTGQIRPTIYRSFKASGVAILTGAITIRTAVRTSASQVFALITSITAADRTTQPANAERSLSVPVTPRTAIVPGESYESGV
jgi:hypothetical protein